MLPLGFWTVLVALIKLDGMYNLDCQLYILLKGCQQLPTKVDPTEYRLPSHNAWLENKLQKIIVRLESTLAKKAWVPDILCISLFRPCLNIIISSRGLWLTSVSCVF